MLVARARCSISCLITSMRVTSQAWTRTSCSAVRPSSTLRLSENWAYIYSQSRPCSSSQASPSRYTSSSRLSTRSGGATTDPFGGRKSDIPALCPGGLRRGKLSLPLWGRVGWGAMVSLGRGVNTRCRGGGSAENERIPAGFHQAMFRIAAIAFVTSATVNVGSSFIGGPHLDFIEISIIGILSYVGAVVSWFFPWHRLPVERFLVVIVIPGLVLLGLMLMATGGIHSHILPIFIAPAVFMAAAYGFRAGIAIALMTAITAALPLFINGWDDYYARTLAVLTVATVLSAYIPARVRQALLDEYENRRRQQEESYVATIGALAAALGAKDRYTEENSRATAD